MVSAAMPERNRGACLPLVVGYGYSECDGHRTETEGKREEVVSGGGEVGRLERHSQTNFLVLQSIDAQATTVDTENIYWAMHDGRFVVLAALCTSQGLPRRRRRRKVSEN